MPSVEKTKNIEPKEVDRTPNFAELQKQKETLFKEAEIQTLKLTEKEKVSAVNIVASHSIKDGFELAKRLGLAGGLTFQAFTNPMVVTKNKKFFDAFDNFLASNESYIREIDKPIESEGVRRIQNGLTVEFGENDIRLRKLLAMNKIGPLSTKIENYYANYIRNRKLASPDLPFDPRTQIEATAEGHLLSNEAMLKESYYTGPIRKFLGLEEDQYLEAHLNGIYYGKPRPGVKSPREDELWALRGNIIDKENLDQILNSDIGEKLAKEHPDELAKVLNKARYAPSKMVFDERKKGAEKGLVKQISDSLIMRGYKKDDFEIKFDEEKQAFEVLDKKDDSFSENETKQITLEDFDKKEFNISQYKYVNKPQDIGGKAGFSVRKNNRKSVIIIEGKESSEYRDIGVPQDIGGKTGFWAKKDNNKYVIVVDGKESVEYKNIDDPHDIGGKVGFRVIKDNGKYVIVIDGKEGSEYKYIGDPQDVGGKVGFSATKDNGKSVIVIDGKESNEYKIVGNPQYIGGKVGFRAVKDNNKDVIIFNGKESAEYKNIDDLHDIGGKVGFRVLKDNGKSVIIIEGKESSEYQYVGDPQDIGGKTGFWAKKDNDKYVIVIDGKESSEYQYVGDPQDIGGKTGFQAKKDNDKYVIVIDGKENEIEGEVELFSSKDDHVLIVADDNGIRRSYSYSLKKDKLSLTDNEQKDLDLVNAVVKEDLPTIEEYFKKYYPEEEEKTPTEKIKSELKNAIEQSKGFVNAVNQTIRQSPELFMDTLRAKDDKPTEFLMSQMFYYMFPGAQGEREKAIALEKQNKRNPWNIFGGGGGIGLEDGKGDFDYDPGMNKLTSVDESGYYEMLKANREVLKLRESLPASTFITQGLFGNYNGSGWTKVNVPISDTIQDPAKETTFEFVDERSGQKINLPKIANAKIISERLKGITSKDEEVPVKILEENSLGEVRVEKSKETKHIVYSQAYSEMPKTMTEVPAQDYDKFKKGFERSFGDVMTKPIGDIGDELDIFVSGLKNRSPREQVIAIQEFCYEYGYYNIDNKPRDTDNFEERLSIMEYRMDELKIQDPKLAHKKYAGICTDFATLTTAILRKAGFVSGIASGFVPEADSLVVKTDRAHAVSFVLWPNSENKEGKPDMIIVDGTPSDITPRIVEQEKKAAEMGGEMSIDAEKKMAELENILKTMDVEAIKKLQNGQLEKTLNQILYGVKQSHVDVMNRVLNASRYAGFDILEMSRGNIEEQIEFRKFLEEEIFKEKSLAHDDRGRRGEELFKLMIEFERRLEKDKNVKGKEEALDVLEKIFDISEKYLDPIETRSAASIVTYLRARKMK